jgi:hypothetical protein
MLGNSDNEPGDVSEDGIATENTDRSTIPMELILFLYQLVLEC